MGSETAKAAGEPGINRFINSDFAERRSYDRLRAKKVTLQL